MASCGACTSSIGGEFSGPDGGKAVGSTLTTDVSEAAAASSAALGNDEDGASLEQSSFNSQIFYFVASHHRECGTGAQANVNACSRGVALGKAAWAVDGVLRFGRRGRDGELTVAPRDAA